MCGFVDNIPKWNIKITPSEKINQIVLEETGRSFQDLPSIDSLIQCENVQEKNCVNFTRKELLILQNLENRESIVGNLERAEPFKVINTERKAKEFELDTEKSKYKSTNSELQVELKHIKWFHSNLTINIYGKENKYLHNILIGCVIILPTNVYKRNPVLEARCQLLRAEQENLKYRKMTNNINSAGRNTLPEDTIAYQVKSINKQLIAVLQFIFSVAAGFAFGFIGIELIIGNLDFGFRLLLGIICALIIALAEMYFLAKKLNEMDKIMVDHHLTKKNL